MTICAECGFDWDGTGPVEALDDLSSLDRRYSAMLSRFLPGEDGPALLRVRYQPEVWSALEYAAHTRDALIFYDQRIRRVLAEDRPTLEAFDFDAACEERSYNAEDPHRVLAGVAKAGDDLAELVSKCDPTDWARIGTGSSGREQTLLDLLRRAAHESRHHLLDIGRVLRQVREAQR